MSGAGGAGGCAIYRPLQVCLAVEGNEDADARRCSRSELDGDPEITRLRAVNLQLADWERQGPHASRDEVVAVLDEQFRFRRAKGGAVDCDGFFSTVLRMERTGATSSWRASGRSRFNKPIAS